MTDPKTEFVERCLAALAHNTAYPNLSTDLPDATTDIAYDIQQTFLRERGESIVGYKAALTALPAQQAMGLTDPVLGVLLTSTQKSTSAPIQVKPGGILETELGYTLNDSVNEQVTVDNVMSVVASVAPIVEIAHPNLASRPQGIDLIATNSATFGYANGPVLAHNEIDLDEVDTELLSGDQRLFGGSSSQVMSGQRNALAWLINTALSLGYPLQAGHLLMTGSIGGITPAEVGAYRATYQHRGQHLAEISFEICGVD
jgi:2-keto-4-pentenoate hydratase